MGDEMKFIANTAEEMRDELVKVLNSFASNHRIAAAKMAGLHKREIALTKANTYQQLADFLGNATIETKS